MLLVSCIEVISYQFPCGRQHCGASSVSEADESYYMTQLHTNINCQHLRSPVSRSWSFCVVGGVLLLRARRRGIRCRTVFVTQLWVSTFSGISWKLNWRDVLSALEIFIWMCYINWRFSYFFFYLLT